MVKIILLCFFITILFVVVTTIINFGFNRNTLRIIFSRIILLRGLFFLILYTCTCIQYMNEIGDNSKYVFLPFVITGIAGMLTMYSKTRKIGFYLAVSAVCFGLFVILPFVGLINSFISGEVELSSIITFIIFAAIGMFFGIVIIRDIKNEK